MSSTAPRTLQLQDRGSSAFFYSEQYGAGLAFKPVKDLRLHVSRQESRQKDLDISQSHLAARRLGCRYPEERPLGLRGLLLQPGEPVGVRFLLSAVSRTSGGASCYRLLRQHLQRPTHPAVERGARRSSTSTDTRRSRGNVFVPLSRRLSIAAEYSYFLQKNANEHQFFIRLIFRK